MKNVNIKDSLGCSNHETVRLKILGATRKAHRQEKDLRVLVDTQLNTNQQCVLATKKTSGILGLFRESVATRTREMNLLSVQH